jgi:phosphoribosylformylglycinamidine cyclo-ligase
VTTYAAAGVSLAAAGEVVERLRSAAESTWSEAVVGGLGGFAGLFALDDERLLAASTDGVGTKLVLAREAGRLRDAGRDLAAHCVNDVLTTGADPLFFLDYVAAHRLELDQVAELVEGAAAVCREAGCALLGGESAEMPGIYRDGEIDFAGTCVGLVRRVDLVDGSRIAAGDYVVGFPSAGLHANGFTLARRVLADERYDGEDLLAPTRLYVGAVRRLRKRTDVRALAHVTGGGIVGNVARVVPEGLRAEIDWSSWKRPPVFAWLARHVDEEELRRVFNLGIGYCAVVPEPADELVIGRIRRA